MHPIADQWNIVVAGNWNPRIFTPQWLGKRGVFTYGGTDEQIGGALIDPLRGLIQIRYEHGGVVLIPSEDRLIIGCSQVDKEHLDYMKATAANILALLAETPVSEVGFNFGFQLDGEPSIATSAALPEPQLVGSSRAYRFKDPEIDAQYMAQWDDGVEIGKRFQLHVHWGCLTPADAGACVSKHYDRAKEIAERAAANREDQ